MNCFEEIELVIDYIENNMNNVECAYISKLTGVPNGLFQRIFAYICDASINEYIRKRRLTEAASKILQGNASVIDIAMECGYDSHSSFTRAFKEQFGVPPTGLTNEIFKTNAYKRFSFREDDETYYVMKGRRIMADLVKVEYVEMDERLVIGISKSITGVGGHELWGVYFKGGYSEILGKIAEYQCTDMEDEYIGIGYCADFKDESSLGNEYIIGGYYKIGTPIPENMISKVIPKGLIVKAQIMGKTLDDIINNAYILIKDMAQKNGYVLDNNNFYWSEIYTYERYCNPAENGSNELILDWYMPCKKS